MKEYILIAIAFLATNRLFSADIEQSPMESLSPEIQEFIVKFVPGTNLRESIQNLKSLGSTNKAWHALLNDARSVQVILKEMSNKLDVSTFTIALALNTLGAQEWLEKQYPYLQKFLIQILDEIIQNDLFNSGIFTSSYFTKLTQEFDVTTFNALVSSLSENIIGNIDNIQIDKINTPILYRLFIRIALLWVNMKKSNYSMDEAKTLTKAIKLLMRDIVPKLNDSPFKRRIISLASRVFFLTYVKDSEGHSEPRCSL